MLRRPWRGLASEGNIYRFVSPGYSVPLVASVHRRLNNQRNWNSVLIYAGGWISRAPLNLHRGELRRRFAQRHLPKIRFSPTSSAHESDSCPSVAFFYGKRKDSCEWAGLTHGADQGHTHLFRARLRSMCMCDFRKRSVLMGCCFVLWVHKCVPDVDGYDLKNRFGS